MRDRRQAPRQTYFGHGAWHASGDVCAVLRGMQLADYIGQVAALTRADAEQLGKSMCRADSIDSALSHFEDSPLFALLQHIGPTLSEMLETLLLCVSSKDSEEDGEADEGMRQHHVR